MALGGSRVARELLVGSYTESLSHVAGRGRGIVAVAVDGDTLGGVTPLAATTNPSYLALDRAGRRLYAVNEIADPSHNGLGAVTAFARDRRSGALTELARVSSGGGEPCHLAVDPSGRFLLVANYASGTVAVFEVGARGELERTGVVVDEALGDRPAHAHMVGIDPVTNAVLVVDLGLDAVFSYRLEESGTLIEDRSSRIELAAGCGPRHLAFHPDGHDLFVVAERSNTLIVLRRSGASFEPAAELPTLERATASPSYAATVSVSPSGRWLAVANRGAESDSIALFGFDAASGTCTRARVEPSGGRNPRDLSFSPDGGLLAVVNQDSDAVSLFAFDEQDGTITHQQTVAVPTPACVLWAERDRGDSP